MIIIDSSQFLPTFFLAVFVYLILLGEQFLYLVTLILESFLKKLFESFVKNITRYSHKSESQRNF